MNRIDQEIKFVFAKSDIERAPLSHPDWSQEQISRSYGIYTNSGPQWGTLRLRAWAIIEFKTSCGPG